MLDYSKFLSNNKSILIAPAGYGKTHTIAECLKITKGKQLILTHTHAGVASIKEKIKKEGIPNSNFEVETISSFAQSFVLSFYVGSELPKQEEGKKYYDFITKNAIILFKLKPILKIIANSYEGLFIDEYQDCTKNQHELILLLSEILPTRILGDPLQGIFGFNGEQLIDLENIKNSEEFVDYELHEPQRWLNVNNAKLGEDLKCIREILESKNSVDLNRYSSIELQLFFSDLYKEKYSEILDLISKNKNILIIDPISTNINTRVKFIQQFKNIPALIESIDDKDFYTIAQESDLLSTENILLKLIELCNRLFNTTGINNWFNKNGFKNKSKQTDKLQIIPLVNLTKALEKGISYKLVSQFFKGVLKLPEVKCYRKELFYTFCSALEESEQESISVYEAMKNRRNHLRRLGRKISRNSIGTTLLTKGLEFDTVIILNAHKFDCPKNLYVAMTRASKRLILYTKVSILSPYPKS